LKVEALRIDSGSLSFIQIVQPARQGRKSAGSKSVDLYVVKQMIGYKCIKTTERYAHHAPESLRPSVRALEDCHKKQSCHVLVTFGENATDTRVALGGEN